jgi:hypothetical protein
MKKRILGSIALLAGAAVLLPSLANASDAAPAPAPAAGGPTVAGWDQFIDSLRSLPARMLAKLPAESQADPQVQQEVARLALEALTSSTLEAIGGDGDAPQFLPSIGQVLNIGQPNADTIYRSAKLTPGGSYRLTGLRGTLKLAVIAQVIPQGQPDAGARAHLDLASLTVDAAGRFDVLLSAHRPEGYTGDWWELNPAAPRLMVRLVSSDWAHEVSPTIAIERVDKPVRRPRPGAADLEARLRALPHAVNYIALMFVDHVEQLRAQGFVNKLKVFDVPFGALAGQFYYEGAYDLADDEALIIDSPVPTKCDYRSLILTNDIYETTDWINNHASLNDAQAAPDSDGRLRIVISAKDPGVRNWMDTSGYARGAVQGRWTGCDSQPIPTVTKVKLSELRAHLPADVAMVTPEQREHILRARRAAYLERPQW